MFKPNSNSYKILVGICSVAVAASIGYLIVWAGTINSPGDPASAGRMYTLENIYNYLTDVDSAVPSKPTEWTGPSAAPGSTMHALDDIFENLVRLPATGQTTIYGTKQREDGYYQSGATLRYATSTIDTNVVVVDENTGLEWEQKTSGNKDTTYTWENAQIYCEDQIGTSGTYAGQSDWRLPNIKELISIVNYKNVSPAIDTTYFPNTVSNYYWSSTTYKYTTSVAWYVDFFDGNVVDRIKTYGSYVRCVRGQ